MTEDEATAFAAGWTKARNDHTVNTIVIRFRTPDGADRAEILSVSGGLARIGHGTYAVVRDGALASNVV